MISAKAKYINTSMYELCMSGTLLNVRHAINTIYKELREAQFGWLPLKVWFLFLVSLKTNQQCSFGSFTNSCSIIALEYWAYFWWVDWVWISRKQLLKLDSVSASQLTDIITHSSYLTYDWSLSVTSESPSLINYSMSLNFLGVTVKRFNSSFECHLLTH